MEVTQTARYAVVIEKRVHGGTVRVHVPSRTPEQEAAFLGGIDRAVRAVCPGRRLIVAAKT